MQTMDKPKANPTNKGEGHYSMEEKEEDGKGRFESKSIGERQEFRVMPVSYR